MPLRRHVRRDGITTESKTVVAASFTIDDARALAFDQARCSSLDVRIAAIEAECRRLLAKWNGRTKLRLGSSKWYAREILLIAAAVRHAIARGAVDEAVADAVELGARIIEFKIKHAAELGLKWPRVARRAARKRWRDERRDIETEVRALLKRHRASGTEQTLAAFLMAQLRCSRATAYRYYRRVRSH